MRESVIRLRERKKAREDTARDLLTTWSILRVPPFRGTLSELNQRADRRTTGAGVPERYGAATSLALRAPFVAAILAILRRPAC
jgi:hypothetical protein